MTALKLQNTTPYSGDIKVARLDVPLHTRGRFTSVEEIKQQVVFTNPLDGSIARIGNVARVNGALRTPTRSCA